MQRDNHGPAGDPLHSPGNSHGHILRRADRNKKRTRKGAGREQRSECLAEFTPVHSYSPNPSALTLGPGREARGERSPDADTFDWCAVRTPHDHHAIGAVRSWRPAGHNGHREQDTQRRQNRQNPPELLHRAALAPALSRAQHIPTCWTATGWARSTTAWLACLFVMVPPPLYRGPAPEIGCGVPSRAPVASVPHAAVRRRCGGSVCPLGRPATLVFSSSRHRRRARPLRYRLASNQSRTTIVLMMRATYTTSRGIASIRLGEPCGARRCMRAIVSART